MSNYTVKLVKHAQKQGSLSRWWLDFPLSDAEVSIEDLTHKGLVFQGWALSAANSPVQLYLKHADKIEYFSTSVARPDVIEIILKQAPQQHPQLHCGFRFDRVPASADFELGVFEAGQYLPLCNGHIAGPFQVLEGKDNWLFLDNDTNKSVEQFTGQYLLDAAAKADWASYLQQMAMLAERHGCHYALLMAPSKEAVYTEYYPHQKAAITPIEQVMQAMPAGFNFCYPLQALKSAARRTFRITDTHWSPFGAMIASVELATMLGFVRTDIEQIFQHDNYREVSIVGDLGNKIYPPRAADESLLKGFNHRKFVVSDNGLANFGRIMHLENQTAFSQQHLVIFGASSSYSMLDFLCRIFGKITMLHTAGNIDPIMLAQLKPDFLVCQTNARYVVRSPGFDYSMDAVIKEKLADKS